MQSIFELSSQYQSLMDKISIMEEIDNETMSSLESINDSLENKILNYTSMIKNMDYKINAIDHALDSMRERMCSLISARDRMKDVIKLEMERCNKKKIENEYHEVSLILNNPKVSIEQVESIPEVFMRTKIKETREPDKEAIKEAINNGGIVPGASLIRETRISIK